MDRLQQMANIETEGNVSAMIRKKIRSNITESEIGTIVAQGDYSLTLPVPDVLTAVDCLSRNI